LNQLDQRGQAIRGGEIGESAVAANSIAATTLDHLIAERLHLARRGLYVRNVDAEVLDAFAALRQEFFIQVRTRYGLDQLDLGVATHRERHTHAELLTLASVGHVFDARRLEGVDTPWSDAEVFPESLHSQFEIANHEGYLGDLANLEGLARRGRVRAVYDVSLL